MSDRAEELSALWRWFGEVHCNAYSPLYERICAAVADDPVVLGMVAAAPAEAHLPLTLLACVHFLVLDGLDHPLADVYAGRSDADPGPLFVDLCHGHATEVAALLRTRRIQTNECGRTALVGPALTWLTSQREEPVALVDVGASAGLTLLCDQYLLDYGPRGVTGPLDSPVRVECSVLGGEPPIAERLPAITTRVGIDRSPVDLSDPVDARWLLACVWPDTGRLERTAASIRLAQARPPTVIEGDANEALVDVLTDLPAGTLPVVTTTWAFAYFSTDERRTFVDQLTAFSRQRPVAWISGEASGVVEEFGARSEPDRAGKRPDVLGVVLFEEGSAHARRLARVHEHGAWIDWLEPAPLPH